MNLIDLFNRRDKTLQAPEGTRVGQTSWAESPWRFIAIPAARNSKLQISDFARTHPAWTQPDQFGWYACSPGGQRLKLEVTITEGGTVRGRAVLACGQSPVPVPIPWPTLGPTDAPLSPKAKLGLRATLSDEAAAATGASAPLRRAFAGSKTDKPARAELQLLVHRRLDRSALYDLAKGTGVEIGPGPKPQILPGPDVDVTYIEEMPRERWVELYDSKGNFGAAEADWSRIQLGKAAALPAADGSLDFIFSSHVFEHLANPLGHLEHWHAKLKPGGHVLMIVPELSATKDRFMRPSTLKEIVREYQAQIWEPQIHHYIRNVMRLNGQKRDPIQAQKLMNRQESIHVHFYDRPGMAVLMQRASAQLGYRGFRLIWSQNHKDFYTVITK